MENKNYLHVKNSVLFISRRIFVHAGEKPGEVPPPASEKVEKKETPKIGENLTKVYVQKGKEMIESAKAEQFKVDPEKDEYNDAEYKEYQELEKKATKIWEKVEPITDMSFDKLAKKIEEDKDGMVQKHREALKAAYVGLGYSPINEATGKERVDFYVSDTFEGSAPEPVKPFDEINAKAIKETLAKWMKGNKKPENKENPLVAIMRMHGTEEFKKWNANVDTLKARYLAVEDKLKKETGVEA